MWEAFVGKFNRTARGITQRDLQLVGMGGWGEDEEGDYFSGGEEEVGGGFSGSGGGGGGGVPSRSSNGGLVGVRSRSSPNDFKGVVVGGGETSRGRTRVVSSSGRASQSARGRNSNRVGAPGPSSGPAPMALYGIDSSGGFRGEVSRSRKALSEPLVLEEDNIAGAARVNDMASILRSRLNLTSSLLSPSRNGEHGGDGASREGDRASSVGSSFLPTAIYDRDRRVDPGSRYDAGRGHHAAPSPGDEFSGGTSTSSSPADNADYVGAHRRQQQLSLSSTRGSASRGRAARERGGSSPSPQSRTVWNACWQRLRDTFLWQSCRRKTPEKVLQARRARTKLANLESGVAQVANDMLRHKGIVAAVFCVPEADLNSLNSDAQNSDSVPSSPRDTVLERTRYRLGLAIYGRSAAAEALAALSSEYIGGSNPASDQSSLASGDFHNLSPPFSPNFLQLSFARNAASPARKFSSLPTPDGSGDEESSSNETEGPLGTSSRSSPAFCDLRRVAAFSRRALRKTRALATAILRSTKKTLLVPRDAVLTNRNGHAAGQTLALSTTYFLLFLDGMASIMLARAFFDFHPLVFLSWFLCCNKVKLSPCKRSTIHANSPRRFMRIPLPPLSSLPLPPSPLPTSPPPPTPSSPQLPSSSHFPSLPP